MPLCWIEIPCFLWWVSVIFVFQHTRCLLFSWNSLFSGMGIFHFRNSACWMSFYSIENHYGICNLWGLLDGIFIWSVQILYGHCDFCRWIMNVFVYIDFSSCKTKKIGDDAIHSFLCFPPLFLLRLFLWSFSTTVLGIFPTFHLVPFSSLFLCTLLGWLVHIAVLMEHWCWILDLFS